MDSVDSHLYCDEEADIIFFHQDVESHDDKDQPSRPISRLGFNRPALPTGSPERHGAHDSEATEWSRSLFQKIGISELRLSALKVHSGGASEIDTLRSAQSTSNIGASNIPVVPSSEEYFESPYESALEGMVKRAKVDRKSPTSPPPVSRLSFPFVTTSPRRNKSAPSLRPPQRHKHSCFPSLMSPEPAGYPSPSHQRHSYRQHGYSRLALQHVKWFWSVREDKWKTCNADLHNAGAYEGVSPDALPVQPAVIHPSDPVPTSYAHSHQTLSPMTIHPRRGDIAALRDPYSFYIDRRFAGLASWTIGKILWMFDVHTAAEKRKMEASIEEDVSDEESENELETSASIGFSDDSDCTLVESESDSDSDLLSMGNTILDLTIIDNDEVDAESPQVCSVGYLDNTSWSQSVYTHIQKSKKSDVSNVPRTTNWYGRWALLVDLSRRDKDRKHLLFESAAPLVEFIPTIKNNTGSHFIPAGKHKYLANDELLNSKLGILDT